MSYLEELTKAMTLLAEHPKTLFVGQAVKYDGQRAHQTFAGVPMEKRIEMPVCEDFQMGFCTGLALEGYIPVCFFPRMDFFILAINQLVNHLSKIPVLGDFRPQVIIRTAVGTNKPLDPGPQHTQNHIQAICLMTKNIDLYELSNPGMVVGYYRHALSNTRRSSILVEHMSHY